MDPNTAMDTDFGKGWNFTFPVFAVFSAEGDPELRSESAEVRELSRLILPFDGCAN